MSKILRVTLEEAEFGYGDGGAIKEISTPLPGVYWGHPQNAWSPMFRSRIPELAGAWVKYEGSHISGSFKDRIVGVTLAELVRNSPGLAGVVVPSSGNAAVSAAALCARMGLPMVAVVPLATPQERVVPVLARGGLVLRAGEGPSDSYALSARIAAALGFARLYSTFASPWAEWGCRSIGREIAEQLGRRPGRIVAPVSAGPVLVGTGNGLREAGMDLPPLVAVQAAGCAPIAAAFAKGAAEVEPWEGPADTKAAAIADRLLGYAQDGTRVLDVVRDSGGSVKAVSDAELSEARAALFAYDGIDAEFSACAGVAWLRREGVARAEDTVCIITASGFKHTFLGDVPEPLTRAATSLRTKLEDFLQTTGVETKLEG